MTMSLIAGVAAFVLTVLAMPHFITYYKIKKIGGQQMHEDVKQHLAKAGTPTMGGTVFLVVAILISLIFNFHVFTEGHPAYGATAGILFVILIYGIIGFLDDFLKIFHQINEGLKPWQKMALQIVAGLLFYFIHVLPSGTNSLAIGGLTIQLGVFYVLFVLFWIVGFSNAVNLTDGIDGLASVSVVISLIAYGIIAFVKGELAILTIIITMIGALLASLSLTTSQPRSLWGMSVPCHLAPCLPLFPCSTRGVDTTLDWCSLCFRDSFCYAAGQLLQIY